MEYQTENSRNGRIHVISYEYDKINRITRVTDSTGAELRYTYNSRNALTSIKEKMEEGKWREMHYFYSNNGRLQRVAETADKEGCGKAYAQTLYEYDGNGNVVKITTPSGNEILRTYDADNLLIKEEHKELGGDIQNCFSYEYDKAENLIKVTDVYGVPVQYEYDTGNRLVSMTGKNGAITKLTYDKNDRIQSIILPKENQEKGENAKGYRYQYDTQDHITSLTACDGTLLYERTYTPYGELEQETDNMGSGIRFVYDYIGRRIQANTTGNAKETYEYDATGNLIATTDGNGNTTRFQVDAWGRIQEILKADESKEIYTYDLVGNLISATDGENHQVRYNYNHAGNLSSRTDASGNTEYFNYDIEGRLNKHHDRNGSETHLYYNMYHDPIRREHKESGLQEIYGYRKDGSLSYAIGGGMRYDYTYYPDGKLHEKKASGKVLLNYEYDLNGNRIRQSDITGKSTTYTYNALDLLEEIRDNKFSAGYQYHSNGMIKSLSVGDKLTTHYEYDKDKNLTRQWTKMAGEVEEDKRIRLGIPKKDTNNMTLLADYHYSYDGNGNRISKEALSGKTSYQYDTLNRLVKVQYPKGLEEFTYDKADNRIRRLTETQEELYKYDVCNRLVEKQTRRLAENVAGTSVNAGKTINLQKPQSMKSEGNNNTGAGHGKAVNLPYASGNQDNLIPFQSSTFQYDNQGNLLREERKTGNSRQESIYSYDGFNRQKKIVNFQSKVQVNHYDGEGLRHEMEENGNLVKFLYADREVVAEEKEDGNVRRFIRGYDLVASDSESARNYYHYASDEQGSITHILDENDEYSLKNYYEYGAFGDFRVKEEEVGNRFGYNGEVFDPIGGQYYLRARYYNPVIGRFTQEDTYYGDGLNLYVYCRNLPIGYEDPSGHICEKKARKLEEKERDRTLTKEEYKELQRYRRTKKSGNPMSWNEFQSANKGKYTQSEMSEAWNKYKQAHYPNSGIHYLHRPYIRKKTIDIVNLHTRTNSKGQIWDDIGEKWVSPDNVELGHRTDYEYWYMRNLAESQGMTQNQFNDFMNNWELYAWQDMHENRSHKKENKHK